MARWGAKRESLGRERGEWLSFVIIAGGVADGISRWAAFALDAT
jgi:hypothetical protein